MSQLKNIKTVSISTIGLLPLGDKGNVFTPSGKKREHKAGRLAEHGGFHETSTPAKLELNLNLVKGTDLDKYNAIVDEVVTIRLSDGTVYAMPEAFAVETVGANDSDSKLTLMSNKSEKIAG
jgi:hypothetical protein